MAQSSVFCPAPNGHDLAEKAISRVLARAQPVDAARPAPDRSGAEKAHPANVGSQSDLGLATNCCRTPEARNQRRQVNGGEVPTLSRQTAVSHLADVSQSTCPRSRCYRFLSRTDLDIKGAHPQRAASRATLIVVFGLHPSLANAPVLGPGCTGGSLRTISRTRQRSRVPCCPRSPSLLSSEGGVNLWDPRALMV